jgi:Flp pilus assembly protein TadG
MWKVSDRRKSVRRGRASRRRGSTLMEFLIIAFMLVFVMLAGIEMSRMLLVYTCVADAAKAGSRYAITHGSDRTGTGVDGPSGPSDDPSQVVSVVTNYASTLINPSNLYVHVTYPDSANTVGSQVRIAVRYTYDPWVKMPFASSVRLSAVSRGIIS